MAGDLPTVLGEPREGADGFGGISGLGVDG